MGRGNQLIFGNIQMSSEVEKMDDLIVKMKEVVRDVGYPTTTSIWKLPVADNSDSMSEVQKMIDKEKLANADKRHKFDKGKLLEEEKKFGEMLKHGSEDEIFGDPEAADGDGTQ
jgi:hypothetical protein